MDFIDIYTAETVKTTQLRQKYEKIYRLKIW